MTGNLPTRIVVRGIGPSLGGNGVDASQVLSDPVIELRDQTGTLIASNNNWRQNQQAEIQATGLAPSDDLEAALVILVQPGAYTAILSGNQGTTGIGLVEIYEIDPSPAGALELVNVSSRGQVGRDDSVLIGGFILGGGSTADIVVRALGPSLADNGVQSVLDDTTLEVYDSNGVLIVANDDWQDAQADEIRDSGLPPGDDREAAARAQLADGAYTIIVRGPNTPNGIGLVEVYRVN